MKFAVRLIRRSVQEFFADNCTQMAAAISYYVLFSIFPLLIFLAGALGLFLQNSDLQEEIIEAVLDFIPLNEGEGRNDVTEAVRGVAGVGSGALGVFGLIGMAWSGSNMFAIIRRSINTAYDLDYQRPFVQQKLIDLAMVAGLSLFLLASVAATAFLRTVREFSDDIAYLGEAAERAGLFWDAASFTIPLGLSFIAFLVLYWVVPATKVSPRDIWPGALLAAVLFEIAKIGFTFYLQNFGNYDVVFGSLGAVAAFLFWVYLSAIVLLLGAEVASEYKRLRSGEYEEAAAVAAPVPLGKRLKSGLKSLFVDEGK